MSHRITTAQRRTRLALAPPPTLTQADVAALARTAPMRVALAREAGWFPSAFRIGQGAWRHFPDEVRAWIERSCLAERRTRRS